MHTTVSLLNQRQLPVEHGRSVPVWTSEGQIRACVDICSDPYLRGHLIALPPIRTCVDIRETDPYLCGHLVRYVPMWTSD